MCTIDPLNAVCYTIADWHVTRVYICLFAVEMRGGSGGEMPSKQHALQPTVHWKQFVKHGSNQCLTQQ